MADEEIPEKIYTAADIKVLNAIDHIRSRPQMYLKGEPNGDTLSAVILYCISDLCEHEGVLVRCEDWWIIAANEDWLICDDKKSVATYFQRFIPYEGPVNAIRPEILVAAFADDIVTATPNDRKVIQGVASEIDPLWNCIDRLSPWKRIVAFRLPT